MSVMPPKGRGRKRLNAEAFVAEIREEATQSLNAEGAILEAFRQLMSTELKTDSIRLLPPKVLWLYVTSKYEANAVSFVTNSITELAVLPPTRRLEAMTTVAGISLDEVSSILWICEII